MEKQTLLAAVGNLEIATGEFKGTKKDHFELQSNVNMLREFIEKTLPEKTEDKK